MFHWDELVDIGVLDHIFAMIHEYYKSFTIIE